MNNIREISFTFKGEKKKIQFINDCRHDRYGFTHISDLYINGNYIIQGRVRYINRTWECYDHQTSMREAVENKISIFRNIITEDYKRDNNVKRLTEKHRKAIEKLVKADDRVRLYKKIEKFIDNNFVKQARKKADDFFNKFKKDYDSLSDKTKEHLAKSNIVIHSEKEAEQVMAVSKVFDLLMK